MKTNLDSAYKTSDTAMAQGIWIDLPSGVGFRCLPMMSENNAYKAAMAVNAKKYGRQIALDTLSADEQAAILTKTFVQTCLVDWRGVEVDGEETPFSKEKAIELLLALPKLAQTLQSYASDFNNYRAELEELGNS